jgi:hypothetical protein
VKLLAFLFLLSSCSTPLLKGEPSQGKTNYSYADVSGSYRFVRESRQIKKKIVTRNQLLDTKGGSSKVLEKTIMVSQIGSIKGNKSRLLTVRPVASEFTVWLEGKKYHSRMQLNEKTKSMRLTLDTPETKWRGTSEIKFPKGKYFCFFSQIPECLYHNYFLTLAQENKNKPYDFYVVWDGYPYIQYQLTRVGQSLFAPATLKFDGEINGQLRYIVEVEGQMILYHFKRSYDLEKIAWIAQGITIVPPGQEVESDDE